MPNRINVNPKFTGRATVNRASGIPRTGPSSPTSRESVGSGISIILNPPTVNMVAGWIFPVSGVENTQISSVSDISGNGNNLIVNTSLTTYQYPMFTNKSVSGFGGYWPGGNLPTPYMTQWGTNGVAFTSTLGVTPASGNITFIGVGASLTVQVGQLVTVWQTSGNANAANVYVQGPVVSYDGVNTLVVNSINFAGTGAHTDWTVAIVWQNTPTGNFVTSTNGSTATNLVIANGGAGTAVETPLTILWCAEMGDNGEPTAQANLFQLGNILFAWKGQNSQFPKSLEWFNGTSSHGHAGLFKVQIQPFAGPVAGAMINGYGGTAGQTAFMANRGRTTATGNWTNATSILNPLYIGGSAGAGGNPAGVIWHEIRIFSDAKTTADLDNWVYYCHYKYGTPLVRSTDSGVIKDRVVFSGDSICDGQNAIECGNIINDVASILGNYQNVEYINYGVGSSTVAQHNTNYASNGEGVLYDSTAPKNILIVMGGYNNDWTAIGTNPAEGTAYTNIQTLIQSAHTSGYKVGICAMMKDSNETGTNAGGETLAAYRAGLNTLILANGGTVGGTAADFIIDTTSTGWSPADVPGGISFDAWCAANRNGHGNNLMYHLWAEVIAHYLQANL